jgi:DNA polymerase III sliding clamp (beta) subunit (PCNA family)
MTAKAVSESVTADLPIVAPVAARLKVRAATLRTMIDVLKLAEQAALDLGPAGISSRVQDPAHVAQASVVLDKGGFEVFECSNPGMISIDLGTLEEFLKLGKADDVVELRFNKASVSVVLGGMTRRIPLDYYSVMPRELKLKSTASVSVAVEEVARSLKACALINDHLRMVVKPDAFVIVASGVGEHEVACRIPKDLLASLTGEAAAFYSLDYVANAVRSIPSGSILKLDLSTDLPLQLSAEFAAGKGRIWYAIAPRIEEEPRPARPDDEAESNEED